MLPFGLMAFLGQTHCQLPTPVSPTLPLEKVIRP